jgi:hypothetical protein
MKYSSDRYYRDSLMIEVKKTMDKLEVSPKKSFFEKLKTFLLNFLCRKQ